MVPWGWLRALAIVVLGGLFAVSSFLLVWNGLPSFVVVMLGLALIGAWGVWYWKFPSEHPAKEAILASVLLATLVVLPALAAVANEVAKVSFMCLWCSEEQLAQARAARERADELFTHLLWIVPIFVAAMVGTGVAKHKQEWG